MACMSEAKVFMSSLKTKIVIVTIKLYTHELQHKIIHKTANNLFVF